MGRDFTSLNLSYCKIISPRPTSLLEGGGDNKDSIKQYLATWQLPAELQDSLKVGSLPSIHHIPSHIPKQALVTTTIK